MVPTTRAAHSDLFTPYVGARIGDAVMGAPTRDSSASSQRCGVGYHNHLVIGQLLTRVNGPEAHTWAANRGKVQRARGAGPASTSRVESEGASDFGQVWLEA